MKKTLRAILIVVLALVVVSSTFIVAYAETTVTNGDDGTFISTTDGGRAYELVWKFKSQDGHMWKRRWNMTTGEWYDPAWILVY
jgi:methionine-rich copper-binding protein CopC